MYFWTLLSMESDQLCVACASCFGKEGFSYISWFSFLIFCFLPSVAVNTSAGILMWEVFTLGKQPYELYDNMQVIEKVSQGYRLYRPQLVSDITYQIMYNCWHEVCVSACTFQSQCNTQGKILLTNLLV